MTFYEWWKEAHRHGEWTGDSKFDARANAQLGWNAAIARCRSVVLSCSEDAHEAAKAKDATDYVAGYQDGVVDCDEALREFQQSGDEERQ